MSPNNSYQVIVVGLGAMGSAALYQLSRRGVSVLGLDQFTPPHAHGSSHGETRLTRQAIGEGEAVTPLALRSYELWAQIQTEAGVSDLLTITGGLVLSSPNPSSPIHGVGDFLGSTLRSARKYQIAHQTLTTSEIQARYPAFRLRGDEIGYWEEKAGFLRPERCVAAQLGLAKQNGAHVHVGEKVVGFSHSASGVTVQTDRGAYHAEKLIVTAGPWIGEFMPPKTRSLFSVYRQVLHWFDVADQYAAFMPERFPVFIWDFGTGESIYGFPALDGRDGGMKIAHEEYHTTTDPDAVRREVSPQETDRMFNTFVATRLFGVNRKCIKSATCLYTVTPDRGFVLDFHPDAQNVIIASPCSGHGFKHSPAIGEALAQMAINGKSDLDLGAFSLTRFGNG